MTTIQADYPELAEFLSAYFTQDFPEEYGSWERAVDDFLLNRGQNQWPEMVLRDLESLLAEERPDSALERYVVDGAMAIWPQPGIRKFLEAVRGRLASALGCGGTDAAP